MQSSKSRAALYLRLSKEDGLSESASIATQRTLLLQVAAERGFSVADIYTDDGYSGTTFDRPAFSRMIRDIEAGKIDIVLVKDLSRLGRDYIMTGRYTELFFPAKGIRCIAVNDGYDSASSDTDIVPFRNILNEMYARDISKKIRSALRAKMCEGKYISAFAPYGYQKDPMDHNRLITDAVAGKIVKSMFHMAAEGHAASEIAARLNGNHIPAPLAYRAIQYGRSSIDCPVWTSSTVTKMLHNPIYCGHSVQGKTRKPSFKSRQTLPVPPEAQIIVRNTHEALISDALFHLVQQSVSARTHKKANRFVNLFSKIACCADCKVPMSSAGTRKKGSPAVLVCGSYKQHGKDCCSNHFIDYAVLYQIVLSVLQEQISLLHTGSSDGRIPPKTIPSKDVFAAASNAEKRLLTLERMIADLYEDLANGNITKAQHNRLLAHCQKEILFWENLVKHPCSAPDGDDAKGLQAASEIELKELTQPVLLSLIDRIEIAQGSYLSENGRRVKRQTIRVFLRFQAKNAEREYRF